jgi:hypothetical protein
MNIYQFYLKTKNKFVILILGVDIKTKEGTHLSNHHVFGQKLTEDFNNPKNELKFQYMPIFSEDDIDYTKIDSLSHNGLIISSDVAIKKEIVDFVIYIDTPLSVLKIRGLTEGYEPDKYDAIKGSYKISKFINDFKGKYYSTKKIINSAIYDKLWDSVIELVKNELGIKE